MLIKRRAKSLLEVESSPQAEKSYEGLTPGTPEWREIWQKYPQLQEGMLKYKESKKESQPIKRRHLW